MPGLTAWSLLVLFVARGVVPGECDFTLLAGARTLKETGDWAISLDRPPAYPALVAITLHLCDDPVWSAQLLAWASFPLTVVAIYRVLSMISGQRLGSLAATVILTLVPWFTLAYARACYEPVTMAVAYWALFFVVAHVRSILQGQANPGVTFAAAGLSALLYNLWYAAAFLSAGFMGITLGVALWKRTSRVITLAAFATGAVILLLPVLRNGLVGHEMTGVPLGVAPAENLYSASVKCAYFIWRSYIFPFHAVIYFSWQAIWAFVLLACGACFGWTMRKNLVALLPLALVVLWLVGIVVGSSLTRIDELNPRFIFPAIPGVGMCVAVLALVRRWFDRAWIDGRWKAMIGGIGLAFTGWFGYHALSRFRLDLLRPEIDWAGLTPSLLWAGAGLASVVTAWFITRVAGEKHNKAGFGFSPRIPAAILVALCGMIFIDYLQSIDHMRGADRNALSPETVAWVRENVPHGALVASNRLGHQLKAYNHSIDLVLLPFVNPANGGYDRAYGNHTLETKEELRAWLTEQEPEFVVFLLGEDGRDPLLADNVYGTAVREMFQGDDAFVVRRVALRDGLVIQVKRQNPNRA